jgi:hypothetical protein
MHSLPDFQSTAIHARYRKAIDAVEDLMDELAVVFDKPHAAIDDQWEQANRAMNILEAMPLGMIPQTEKGDK